MRNIISLKKLRNSIFFYAIVKTAIDDWTLQTKIPASVAAGGD
jgi:hypothetical protein